MGHMLLRGAGGIHLDIAATLGLAVLDRAASEG